MYLWKKKQQTKIWLYLLPKPIDPVGRAGAGEGWYGGGADGSVEVCWNWNTIVFCYTTDVKVLYDIDIYNEASDLLLRTMSIQLTG